MFWGARAAEELNHGSEPDHEVVVLQRRHVRELHRAALEIDRRDGCLVDGGVLLMLEEIAQRMGDRGRLDQARCQLVEHGLETVVVVRVDQHDVRRPRARASARHPDRRTRRRGRRPVAGRHRTVKTLLPQAWREIRTVGLPPESPRRDEPSCLTRHAGPSGQRRNTTAVLCPPNPNEFDTPISTCALRATFAM